MRTDYQTFVYRTDVTPEKFCGAFFDEKGANGWVKKQKEGTYEVSTEKPGVRKERLGTATATEEAARD